MEGQIEVVRKRELERTVSAFVQDIADAEIIQKDWGELLSAAPLSLSLLGACRLVASSPRAESVTLTPPEGGFKYLRYKSLQANLVQLSNFGCLAFLEADRRMDKLAMHCKYMFGANGMVNNIIAMLCDEPAAKRGLRTQMLALKRGADDCAADSKAVEAKFEQWLRMAWELHETATEGRTATKQLEEETNILLQQEQIREDESKRAVKARAKALNQAKQMLDTTEQAFRQASQNIPSGWSGLAMHIVKGYNDQIVSAMQACTQAFKSACGLVPSTVSENPAFTHPDANDPAFYRVPELCTILSTFSTFLQPNGDGLIDLESLWSQPTTEADSHRSGIVYFQTSLDLIYHGTNWTPCSWPSDTCKSIISDTQEVICEIVTERKQQRQLNASTLDITAITKWQAKISGCYQRALALKAQAAAIPGFASGNGVPLLNAEIVPDALKRDQSAAAFLSEAVNNLKISQAAMEAAADSYDKSTDKFLESTAKFKEIQHHLRKLDAQKATIGDIRRVLVASIQSLSEVKHQISALLEYFQGISNMVEFVVETHCRGLLDRLNSGILCGDNQIAGISYEEFEKQAILTSTLVVRGYFSVIHEIAKAYGEISTRHIMPGCHLLDILGQPEIEGMTAPAGHNRGQILLDSYARNAMEEIQALATRRQRQLKERMAARIADIASTTKTLPPTPQTNLINEAMEENKKIKDKEIENKKTSLDSTKRLFDAGLGD